MKIKKIKIENFGKLSSYEKDFTDGINVINEENGWGKSTLVAFIKVMFFGFDGEGKRSKLDREREYYRPWQSGAYGGSIVFEANGKEYKLNRSFGSKANEDSFGIYDAKTLLPSTDFTTDIGEEIFKLDSESFQRTVLFKQEDIETSATDKIHANLGNLTSATDDINNYEEVSEKFKKKLHSLSLTYAKGELNILQNEITSLENDVRQIPNVEQDIESKNKALEELKAKLEENKKTTDELNIKLKETAKLSELSTKKDQYDGICQRLKQRENALKLARDVFTNGIPNEEEINSNIENAKRLNDIELKAASNKLSSEEETLLAKDASSFAEGIPNADVIQSYILSANDVYEKEKKYLSLQFSEEEQKDFDILSKKFEGKEDLEQKIFTLSENLAFSNNIKAAIASKQLLLHSYAVPKEAKKESALWLVLLIIGLVLAGAGTALIFTVSKLAGIITASVGAALVIAGILVKVLSKPKEEAVDTSLFDNLKAEIEKEEKLIASTEDDVKTFFGEFGLEFDNIAAIGKLAELKNEYKRYTSLVSKKADQRDDNLEVEISNAKEKLEKFLSIFNGLFTTETDFVSKLQTLKFKMAEYGRMKKQKEVFDALQAELDSTKNPILEYIKSVGINSREKELLAQLDEIKDKLEDVKRAEGECNDVEKEKHTFEAENNIDEIVKCTGTSKDVNLDDIQEQLDEASAQKDELVDSINEFKNKISLVLEDLDNLYEKKEELSDKQDEFDTLTKREALISKTKIILDKAKTSFTGKYSSGIASGFKKYYELLDGTNGNEYSFDANMNLKIDDKGEFRDIHSYSLGSQDKINICFRMGLVEAMFAGEKPVIIMDDPFTNFDQKRIDGAKKFLDVLKDNYQILYLTCHDSRVLK